MFKQQILLIYMFVLYTYIICMYKTLSSVAVRNDKSINEITYTKYAQKSVN